MIEVLIIYFEIEVFLDLELKWYGVLIIFDMKFEVGGIYYNVVLFNGWYMGMEIGVRNLVDEKWYDKFKKVVFVIGIFINYNIDLWKD